MFTLLTFLAYFGNDEINREGSFYRRTTWLCIKGLTFCILALGFCYGSMAGTVFGLTISGILNLESPILCYLVITVSGFTGLIISIIPAYAFHFISTRLAL